jgi:hypothetical protein
VAGVTARAEALCEGDGRNMLQMQTPPQAIACVFFVFLKMLKQAWHFS